MVTISSVLKSLRRVKESEDIRNYFIPRESLPLTFRGRIYCIDSFSFFLEYNSLVSGYELKQLGFLRRNSYFNGHLEKNGLFYKLSFIDELQEVVPKLTSCPDIQTAFIRAHYVASWGSKTITVGQFEFDIDTLPAFNKVDRQIAYSNLEIDNYGITWGVLSENK